MHDLDQVFFREISGLYVEKLTSIHAVFSSLGEGGLFIIQLIALQEVTEVMMPQKTELSSVTKPECLIIAKCNMVQCFYSNWF